MNIAVIGYGVEGQSCYEYFSSRGHNVTICDKSTEIIVPDGAESQLGDNYLSNLDRFDLIIRSAGINRSVILEQNPNVGPKISTAINQFMQHAPTQNIIGITGTKGKGTTSTLITRIIESSGNKAWLGGNIGNSPLDFIDEVEQDDWVVLELSSFQLSDIQYSPHIAVCLMVVPEHLDWHEDLGDYTHAKSNLFKYQEEDDVAIYYVDNATSSQIAHSSRGRLIPYMASPGAIVKKNGDIEIAFTQIAGLIARRIRCDIKVGQDVTIGELYGLIRFGSRVDIYLPPNVSPLVFIGQKMIGGETVIADLVVPTEQRSSITH